MAPRLCSGLTKTLTAKIEVILSAGAYGTPRVLLSSGIGPTADLTALGITTVLDVPDVGKNLQDHIGSFYPFVTSNVPAP